MTSPLKDAVLSFYSGEFYGELARFRTGIGMRLITLLSFFMTCLYFVPLLLSVEYTRLHDNLLRLPAIVDKLPAVIVNNGHLAIDKPVPYTFDIGTPPQHEWVVIDTKYQPESVAALELYMQKNKASFLLTSEILVALEAEKAPPEPMLRVFSFRDSQPFTITHDTWNTLAAMVENWGIAPILLVFSLTTFFALIAINFAITFFSAVAIMGLNIVAATGFAFPAAMRLAAAARIPVNLLASLPIVLGLRPLYGISELALWAMYMVFAAGSVYLFSRLRLHEH